MIQQTDILYSQRKTKWLFYVKIITAIIPCDVIGKNADVTDIPRMVINLNVTAYECGSRSIMLL